MANCLPAVIYKIYLKHQLFIRHGLKWAMEADATFQHVFYWVVILPQSFLASYLLSKATFPDGDCEMWCCSQGQE